MTRLPENWDQMSVSALWDAVNDPRRRGDAPQSTYEALLYELRTLGVAQLAENNNEQLRTSDLIRDLIDDQEPIRSHSEEVSFFTFLSFLSAPQSHPMTLLPGQDCQR